MDVSGSCGVSDWFNRCMKNVWMMVVGEGLRGIVYKYVLG